LLKILPQSATWPIEQVDESLVEFQDWMVDEKNPNGITIMNEVEFIKSNPQYLELDRPALGNKNADPDSSSTARNPTENTSRESPSARTNLQVIDEDTALEDDLFGDL